MYFLLNDVGAMRVNLRGRRDQMTLRAIGKNVIFVGILMFIWLSLGNMATGQAIYDFPKRLLAANILLVAGRYFFASPRLYCQLMAIFLCIGISVFSLRAYLGLDMEWPMVFNSELFLISLSTLLAVVPNCIGWKCLRLPLAIILWGCFILAASLFWLYYMAEGSWLGFEALLAIVQTNAGETFEYINMHGGWGLLFFCLLFLVLLLCLGQQIMRSGGMRIRNKRTACVLLVFVVYNIAMANNMFARNCFTAPFINAYTGFEEYNAFKAARESRRTEINPADISARDEKGVYVLVMGESETKEHMAAYGYPKATTPWLSDMAARSSGILFTQAYSCHTHTVPVWSYALTEKNQYNNLEQANAVSLVEAAKAAGYEVVWLSNQVHYGAWDTPVSVIADAADQQIFLNSSVGENTDTDYFDGKLADVIDKANIKDKTLLIVHLMGCHGAYESRYPKDMAKFSGDDDAAHYDNAVYYNDMVLESVYNKVAALPNFQGMVYLSDHGEAVEQKLGHNSGKFEPVMAKIPMYMIFSQSYQQEHADSYRNLAQAKDKIFTNDLLYNTLLGIMGIQYRGHDEPQNDLSNADYDSSRDRFCTLYGKIKIRDIE